MGRPARDADFFRVWTPDMAYVLGYWWADGYMRIRPHGAHDIEIASLDCEHLLMMANKIGGNFYWRKVRAGSECYEAIFCSVEMYRDIERLGGTPRKSRTMQMPIVPTHLLVDFVRGFVDGDGTLSCNAGKPILQIYSASDQFLVDLGREIEMATGIPAPNLAKNRANWYLKWSTIRAQCLAAWLYVDNAGLALERKSTVADMFLQWKPKKKPQVGTITDGMRRNFPAYIP